MCLQTLLLFSGLLSLLSYREGDPINYDRYKPLREYFVNNSTEAVTPYSAKYAYPYFYEYHLVKLVAVGDVARKFAVMFLAPKHLRKPVEDYAEVVRYYNDPTTKIIRDVYWTEIKDLGH